ncbi:aminoglycoside phosphotransferase family protein [Halomonas sp. DP8Y7-1]|uniref:aminoglycoside phosphotransferase family protein n=1 Tax=Halomonas sp. DP8Y7-1 TaxID=2859078 RepID=UPI001C97B0B1|nr:aminoglycoside phosphotransferase family protein [Halomonas sp. DP8Y7-1]MBY6028288.1 aminoglycoside phosphotransferase family protein [Halomonas sp. DP8Y7-1]
MEKCAPPKPSERDGPPLAALKQSLSRHGWPLPQPPACTDSLLQPLADTGLAHWHVRLPHSSEDGAWLARLPKQSQLGLDAASNLNYQVTCFTRAQASGHTPRLNDWLPCDELLPRGGLVVEAIDGRSARLPSDLPAMTTALASLHSLPLPALEQRSPLLSPADPWRDMLDDVRAQARHLPDANLSRHSLPLIEKALSQLPSQLPVANAAVSLISFDAHPGNFLITPEGRAVLVDLEKCRYSLPGFDLAHMSLYTSTTWDLHSRAVLFIEDLVALYQRWRARMTESGRDTHWRNLMACRHAMWLWSLTWCAKWRAQQHQQIDRRHRGEDWSAQLSQAALVDHVADRVDHYLSAPIIQRVTDELAELADAG